MTSSKLPIWAVVFVGLTISLIAAPNAGASSFPKPALAITILQRASGKAVVPAQFGQVPNNPANVGSGAVTFTVNVTSVYGHQSPDLASPRAASIFAGQTYAVTGRSADDTWLSIMYWSVPDVWVLAAWGTVAGNLDGLPVLAVEVTPTPASTAALAALTPTPESIDALATPAPAGGQAIVQVGSRARQIYEHGLALGNSPDVFTKIGDCNSTVPEFLGAFDNRRSYQLGGTFQSLQDVIDTFAGSFSRPSQAAVAGFSAAAVLDPAWSNPAACISGETPLQCEFRLVHPSFAFVSLGTNSTWQTAAAFEADMRTIIQYLIDHGVVPILGTKADNVEGDDHMNGIVVRLAAEYDIPLWQFALAARGLPDGGLVSDRYHLTWGPQVFDDPTKLQYGWQLRNLTGLQALDVVWRAVR